MRLAPRLAVPVSMLVFALAGCGGATVAVQEVPGDPAPLDGAGQRRRPRARHDRDADPHADRDPRRRRTRRPRRRPTRPARPPRPSRRPRLRARPRAGPRPRAPTTAQRPTRRPPPGPTPNSSKTSAPRTPAPAEPSSTFPQGPGEGRRSPGTLPFREGTVPLRTATDTRADENRPLHRLALEAAQAASSETLRAALATALRDLLGADLVRVLEISQDGSGACDASNDEYLRFEEHSQSGTAHVLATGRPLVVPDARDEHRRSCPAARRTTGSPPASSCRSATAATCAT